MAKERHVRIELMFLCEDDEQAQPPVTARGLANSAVEKAENFVASENEGSYVTYTEHKKQDGTVTLSLKLFVMIDNMGDDEVIELKLDNNLSNFPPLSPGFQPRFYYQADGIA
jgi:hypothetical protein